MSNKAAQSLVSEFGAPAIHDFAVAEGLPVDNLGALAAAELISNRFANHQMARLAVRSFCDRQSLLRVDKDLEQLKGQRDFLGKLWPWIKWAVPLLLAVLLAVLSFFGYRTYADLLASINRAVDDSKSAKKQVDEALQKLTDTREKVTDHVFNVSSEIGSLFRKTDGMDEDMRGRFHRNTDDLARLQTSFTKGIDEIVADHTRLEIEMLMTELDDAILFSFNPDTEANVRQAKSLLSVNLLIQHVASHRSREPQSGPTKEQRILLVLRELADTIGQVSRIRAIVYAHGSTDPLSGDDSKQRLKALEADINALEHRAKTLHLDQELFSGLHSASDDPQKETTFPHRAQAFRSLTLGNIPLLRFEGLEHRSNPERLVSGEPYLKEIKDGENSVRWQARIGLAVLYLDRAGPTDGNAMDLLNNAVRELEEAAVIADSATTRAETANNLADAYYRMAQHEFAERKAAGANGAAKIGMARKDLEDAERFIRRALREGAFTSVFPVFCATDAEILATSVIIDEAKWSATPDDAKKQMFQRIRERVERSQGVYEQYGFDAQNFFTKNPVYEQVASILGGPDPKRIAAMKQEILAAALLK